MLELGNSLTVHEEEGSTPSLGVETVSNPPKKKRNLPGMPDPEAEVIALSPRTLLATNRFICEICNKGFQRDQNLQLHRRGHNLPWKLRQRTDKEIRKKVYVCPESSCIHHDPKRALGDLTGIKKHFFRKHGEKKWKCDRCSKNYAVRSDWKAHMKTCGSKEYRCDCGTLFSRRDSFITHRAFCEALAHETAEERRRIVQSSSSSSPPSSEVLEKQTGTTTSTMQVVLNPSITSNNGFHIFPPFNPQPVSSFPMFNASPMSLSLADHYYIQQPAAAAAMSATALLQKAAQVGAAAASSSFLCGLGFHTPSSENQSQPESSIRFSSYGSTASDLMMGPISMNLFCGNKPTSTLDLLGMGIGGDVSGGGFSSLIGGGGGSESSSGGHVYRGVDEQQLWKGMKELTIEQPTL